jgi:hypothetical protein
MSDEFEKYAVYWVPKRADALARFGASWTGWCSDQGERRARGAFGGLSVDLATITKRCRRHGFHGVVKTTFRLGDGRSRFSLEHILGRLAEDSAAFQLPRLRLAVVDRSVALVPVQTNQTLVDLVTQVDQAFAPLDAAPPSDDFATSADGAPTPHGDQIDQVIKFPTAAAHRFHIPLSDPINPELALELIEMLQPVLEPMLQQPRQLNDLALMGDPGEGRPLRLLLRYELRNWPLRQASRAMPCQGPHVLLTSFDDPLVKAEIAI